MANHSFEIRSSKDLFKKLEEDYNDLDKEPLSSRHAINCAMTAWHLVDWTLIEFESIHGYSISQIGDYRKFLDNSSLDIMGDIANGSKHLNVTRPRSDISNTQLHDGDFDPNDFSSEDFDVSCLELEMKDGTKKVFIEELEKVILFWETYLNNN
jgi:hypothetical protein